MILIIERTYLVNFQNYLLQWLLVLVGCSSTPFMQNNIVATKYLLDNFVEDAGGKGQVNAETYHWEVDATH